MSVTVSQIIRFGYIFYPVGGKRMYFSLIPDTCRINRVNYTFPGITIDDIIGEAISGATGSKVSLLQREKP
jgi:hypothetical protein